jgi:hypothetical protein
VQSGREHRVIPTESVLLGDRSDRLIGVVGWLGGGWSGVVRCFGMRPAAVGLVGLLVGLVGLVVVGVCVLCGWLCGQVVKGARWMPWHQEPMKDVGACDMPRGAGNRAVIRGFPNGGTRRPSWVVTII